MGVDADAAIGHFELAVELASTEAERAVLREKIEFAVPCGISGDF